ncbi:Protein of unknown function [Cotesia congregata]|uniref:Uncharacterized protein n=1 Tax=Cotesia congregata TaxID=51543 RepID=A0A8J2HJG1_COTCN|nr:Protein of unknown function [Cotesia congregata]
MFHYQLRDQLPVTLPKKLTLDKEILNLRQAVDWLKISLVRSVALKRSEKPILWTLSSTARVSASGLVHRRKITRSTAFILREVRQSFFALKKLVADEGAVQAAAGPGDGDGQEFQNERQREVSQELFIEFFNRSLVWAFPVKIQNLAGSAQLGRFN